MRRTCWREWSAVRGGGPPDRAQRVLWLVAEHGVLDTTQVAVLLGVSRATAHRVLDALANAELLERHREPQGRDHRWSYQLSWSGRREVTQARRRANLPLLSELSREPARTEGNARSTGSSSTWSGRPQPGADGGVGVVAARRRRSAVAGGTEHPPGRTVMGPAIWVEDGVDGAVRAAVVLVAGTLEPAAVSWPCLSQAAEVDAVLVVTSSAGRRAARSCDRGRWPGGRRWRVRRGRYSLRMDLQARFGRRCRRPPLAAPRRPALGRPRVRPAGQ